MTRIPSTSPPSRARALLPLALLLGAGLALAQNGTAHAESTDCGGVLIEAQNAFAFGRFEEVSELLGPCTASGRSIGVQIAARSLLAKALLAQDDLPGARVQVESLLRLRPSYEADVSDSLAFRELVQRTRSGRSEPTITSVSKKAETLREAPATVIVVTAEEIRRRGYQDLEALLHDLPGFDFARTNGLLYSHIYQRGYRSENTNRTLLLVDGVEQNSIWSSNLYISRQFPLSNVEAVEVVYGPASTMYGANAFLGVINVITKDPRALVDEGRRFGGNAEVTYGSWNTRTLDFTVAGVIESAGLSYSLTGRRYDSDEPDVTDEPEWDWAVEDPAFYLDRLTLTDPEDVAAFLAQYCPSPCDPTSHPLFRLVDGPSGPRVEPTEAAISQAQTLDRGAIEQGPFGSGVSLSDGSEDWYVAAKFKSGPFTLAFEQWQRDEGPGTWFDDTRYSGFEDGTRWVPRQSSLSLKYEQPFFSDRLTLMSFTRFKEHALANGTALTDMQSFRNGRLGLTDLLDGSTPSWTTQYFHQVSEQIRSEFKAVWVPSSRFDLVAGIEWRQGQIQGDRTVSLVPNPQETGFPGSPNPDDATIQGKNSFDVRDLGAYVQGSYRPGEDWKIVLAGRFDDNTIDSSGGYGTVFNPRAAVVFTPGEWTFKAIYAEAFKDASNRDKFSAIPGFRIANPNLEPERVNNIEVVAARPLTDRIQTEVALYQASYSDALGSVQVVLPDGTVVQQNQGVGSLEIRGVQATARASLGDHRLDFGYTFTDPENTDSGVRIGDIASHRLHAGVELAFLEDRLDVSLRSNYVGPRDTGEDTTADRNPFDEIDGYVVVDASVSYELPWRGLETQLTVFNLLDESYYDPGIRTAASPFASRLVQPGRSLFFTLRYGF